MARPSLELITALRATADRLEGGVRFQWSHMGSCNCGHLAQTLTKLGAAELHARGLETPGDWAEHCRDYCPDSGISMDAIIGAMVDVGLTTVDIANLERLCADEVLDRIPPERLPLEHRNREHAVLYLRTWADLLEQRWLDHLRRRNAERAASRKKLSTV